MAMAKLAQRTFPSAWSAAIATIGIMLCLADIAGLSPPGSAVWPDAVSATASLAALVVVICVLRRTTWTVFAAAFALSLGIAPQLPALRAWWQGELPAQDLALAMRACSGLIAVFSGLGGLCLELRWRWPWLGACGRVAFHATAYLCLLAAAGSLGALHDGSRLVLPALSWIALTVCVGFEAVTEYVRSRRQQEDRLKPNWTVICASIAAGITLVVLAGWLIQSGATVRAGTLSVPMQFNAACGLLLLAIAARGLGRRRLLVTWALCVPGMLLALTGVAEELNAITLSVDQWLLVHRITAEDVPPGRVALSTAISMLLLAMASLLTAGSKPRQGMRLLAWSSSLLALTIGLLSLTGYVLGLPLVRAWGTSTPMAFNTACVVALLGLGGVLRGLRVDRAYGLRATLIPVLAVLVVVLATAQLWFVSTQASKAQRQARDQDLLDRAATNFSRELLGREELLQQVADGISVTPLPPEQSLGRSTARLWRIYPGLQALAWSGKDGQVLARYAAPRASASAPELLASGRFNPPFPAGRLSAAENGLAVLALDGANGRLLAMFDLALMQKAILRDAGLEDLVGVRTESSASAMNDSERHLEALGFGWRLWVVPDASPLVSTHGREPALVMLGGLFFAGLFAIALRMALMARGAALEVSRQSLELRERNVLLQQLSGGIAPAAIPGMLIAHLSEQWPDAAVGILVQDRLETRAWPDGLDAEALLHGLIGEPAARARTEADLRTWAGARRLIAASEILSDPAGRDCGAIVLLRQAEEAPHSTAALLDAAADVTRIALARHAEQMELRDLHRTYESLMAYHPDAVLEVNPEGLVRDANDAAQSLLQDRSGSLIGLRLEELFDPIHSESVALRLQNVREGRAQAAEVSSGAPARGRRELELTRVPRRRGETVDGAFALLHDITRLRAADRALRHSHEQSQLFSRRLIALNECAVALAIIGERGLAGQYLARSLCDTLKAGAIVVRLATERGEHPAQQDIVAGPPDEGERLPQARAEWFAEVGAPDRPRSFDREGLLQLLPPSSRPGANQMPQRNWTVVPMRSSDGSPLGHIEMFDANAQDDLEEALTIAAQFAQLGAATIERLGLIEDIRAAEERLTRQLAFTEAVAGSIGDAVYAVDREGRVNYLNTAAEHLFGPRESILDQACTEARLIGRERAGLAERALAEKAVVSQFDVSLVDAGGRHFPASCSASPLYVDSVLVGAVVVVRDVSERHRAEVLQRERDRFFELSLELFCIADTEGHFHQINDAFTRTLGYAQADLLERPWIDLVHPDDRAATQANADALYRNGRLTDFVNRYRHADGSYRLLEWNAQCDSDGRVYATARDITERRRIETELSHHATHDALTGLPNLLQQQQYLQAALAGAAKRGGRVTVFYIDMDHFHAVNEARGHVAGDVVLREIARRLSDAAGEHGQASRIAGDEFVLVLDELEEWVDQGETGEDLRTRVEEPMLLEGEQFFITCSIGVSCFPDNGTTPLDLIRQAEAAMLRAKHEGRNTVVAFSNDQLQALQDRQSLGARLRDAIRDEELVLHYQPQIRVHDWQVCGVEALVRWQNPELGLLLPSRFIQVAEEMGLIVEIGQWVLERACRQAKAWLDGGLADFSVAVNVSGLQLQRPDFLERVRRALDASNLPPRYLELELTESIVMEHVERVITTMRALKALGVMISLDDFGSGYSSLSYLRRFPIDKLKIDQNFVRDITGDAKAAGICRAIIALGHQLGLTVSAVGVESIGQTGFLRRAECDQFQGNYFSLPLPDSKAFEVLRRRYINSEQLLPVPSEEQSARTLLLVDDEENVLRALVRLLRRDGYQILTAMRPRDAMEILASQPVQVILSDQRMPDQSGTEFLSHVKEMYPETVRLILSGYSDLASLTDAINRGAIYRFIAKPWDDEDLRRQIREAFRLFGTRPARLG